MTSLSNRTYPMLKAFAEGGSDFYMPIHQAQVYDQRPFRAMLVRRFIVYRAGRGFHITKEGRAAWEEFLKTEIFRKDPYRQLTRAFDPAAYGLKNPYQKKTGLHVVNQVA